MRFERSVWQDVALGGGYAGGADSLWAEGETGKLQLWQSDSRQAVAIYQCSAGGSAAGEQYFGGADCSGKGEPAFFQPWIMSIAPIDEIGVQVVANGLRCSRGDDLRSGGRLFCYTVAQ